MLFRSHPRRWPTGRTARGCPPAGRDPATTTPSPSRSSARPRTRRATLAASPPARRRDSHQPGTSRDATTAVARTPRSTTTSLRGDGRTLRAHGRDGRERGGVATGGMIMGRSLSGGVETVQPSPTGAKARGGRRRGRVQPHGGAHLGPTPHEKAQSAAPTSHRMRFSVTSPPGRRGARPPASLRGTMESGPTGQTCSGNQIGRAHV